MNFELRQIRQLSVIAEVGSFRAAAERLHVAQPALSVSIRKLEDAVGAQLLMRGARGAELTEAGRAFLDTARYSLFHAAQGQENARLAAAGEIGSLRVGFVGSAVYRLLPRVLRDFRTQHPAIRLELSEGATVGLLDAVRERRLDLGIVRRPIPADPELIAIDLERDRLVAMLSAEHPLAGEAEIDLAALADDPFVIFSPRAVPGLHAAVVTACALAGFVPRIAQEVTQSTTMVGLVGSGLGVALSPAVIANISGAAVRFVAVRQEPQLAPLLLVGVARAGNTSRALRLLWESLGRSASA